MAPFSPPRNPPILQADRDALQERLVVRQPGELAAARGRAEQRHGALELHGDVRAGRRSLADRPHPVVVREARVEAGRVRGVLIVLRPTLSQGHVFVQGRQGAPRLDDEEAELTACSRRRSTRAHPFRMAIRR